MKILVPITYGELGGSQLFLLKLIDAMADTEFSFECWLFEDGPLRQELEERSVPCHLLPSSWTRTPWGLFRLWRRLNRERPDMIYLHASRLIALVARIAGIPCVERINMSRNAGAGGGCRYPFIDRMFTNLNTRVLAVSEAIKNQLLARGVKEEKITVIHNFVDAERFRRPELRRPTRNQLGIPDEAIVVLNVGRMVPQKAQSDFLKVAAQCLPKNERLYFLLVGDGPLKSDLEREGNDLGLRGRFQILPFQKEIERIYSAADILLHTAHWDPLANVLLEAMAAGLAVVATDVDGTREAIAEYSRRTIIRPGNTGHLAAAVLEMVDSTPSLKVREVAECLTQTFSKKQFVQKWRTLLEELNRDKSAEKHCPAGAIACRRASTSILVPPGENKGV